MDQESERQAKTAVVVLLIVQVLFGSISVAGKFALEDVPPMALVAIRIALGALCLLALQRIFVGERVAPRDHLRLALYGLFGVVINQLLYINGLSRTEAVPAQVLVTTIPVFTLLVAVLLKVERPGWRKYTGVAMALTGVAIMVGVTEGDFSSDVAIGNLMVTLNALSYAIYLVIARGMMQRYDPLTVGAWTFVWAAVITLPLGAWDIVHTDWQDVGPAAWWSIAYIVLGGTVGAYALNNWALRHTVATTVAVYIYLQPIVAAVLAYFLRDELPTTTTLIGAAFIFVGVGFALIARKSGKVRIAG